MVTAFYPIAVTTQRNFRGVLMSLVLILNRRHIVLAANETNIPGCDTGPNALSEAFGMDVPRTCIDFRGVQRCYYTLISPTCETPEDFPAPLVIDNHAGMSCPLYSAFYTGWADIALTKECLIVVWPTGILDPNISSDWSCFGVPGGATLPVEEEQDISIERNQQGFSSFTCCCAREGSFIDDATDAPDFLRAVIEDVVTMRNEYSTIVDPKRIYMAGHSNGCMASLATAAVHSDVVAGVCCHAGAMITPFAEDYEAVPTWLVHGLLDGVIPWSGQDFGNGFGYLPLPGVFNAIADKNGCDEEIIEQPLEDNTGVVVGTNYLRTNCDGGSDVQIVALNESGHIPYPSIPETFGAPGAKNTTFETTPLAWNFCSSFSKERIPDVFTAMPMSVPSEDSTVTFPTASLPTEAPSPSDDQSSDQGIKVQTLSFWFVGFLAIIGTLSLFLHQTF